MAGSEEAVAPTFLPLTMSTNRGVVVPGDVADALPDASSAAPGDLSEGCTDTSEDSRKYICTRVPLCSRCSFSLSSSYITAVVVCRDF